MASICIITPQGMKCIDSPCAQHYPGNKACEVIVFPADIQNAIDAAVADCETTIRNQRSTSGQRVASAWNAAEIARVVRLLIECDFDLTHGFTIAKAQPKGKTP